MRRWFGRTLTRKFTFLLAGFLVLQVVQLLAIATGVLHIGEEVSFINEAGKQRMRSLLVASHSRTVVYPVGGWKDQRASIIHLSETIDHYSAFYDRLTEAQKQRGRLANWLDHERVVPAYRLLEESRTVWENELRPLAVTVAMAPSTRQSIAALRKLEAGMPAQLLRINQAVALLEANVRANTDELAVFVSSLLVFSLTLGLAGFIMARHKVTFPLRRLVEATAAVAKGAYDRRVTIGGEDELGHLGQAFNHMAEAIGEKTSRIIAFQEVAALITFATNSEEIIHRIMRHGAEAIGARAACVALRDEGSGQFRQVSTHGLSKAFVDGMVFRAGGLADQALASGEPCLSSDAPGARHRLSELACREGIRSFVCLPLIAREVRIGVVYFYRHDEEIFSAEELDVLVTFARLAAQSIQNMRLYQRVSDEARTDGLTGLRNRRVFDRRLEEEHRRAQRYDKPYALMMIDIDHFKQINDCFGHPAGDAVLRRMGKIILEQVRDVDIAARYGGEEFAVILPEISGTPARNVAERLRAAVEQELFRLPNGNEIGVTVTIGISCYPNCSTDTTAIISTADQALYVGKQSGRNRTLLYRETLKARIDKDPDLIVQLLGESLGNVLPIVTAISAKAPFLRLHSDVVNEAAQRLAAAMHLSAGEIETLRLAALLHDIGMLVVPDKVLIRRGPLAPEDWQEIRRHPVAGADLLARVPALAEVAKIVRHHHERYDGRGYPDGLQAGDLPLLARILAIAVSYGTMVSDWPGHKAVPREEACRRLREGAGTQFDPDMVERLIQSLPAEDCGGSQALSA